MNRLFRNPDGGLSGYAALGLFAAAYLTALAVVVSPGTFLGVTTQTSVQAEGTP